MMNKLILGFFFIVFAGETVVAQGMAVWNVLADVRYGIRYDEDLEYDVEYPIFSEKIKALEGKEVEVKGYMIPLDELIGQNFFILSAFPFNMCFFCGGAGPETVIEINTLKRIQFTEEPILIKGKLELNQFDYNHMMYILNDAVLVD